MDAELERLRAMQADWAERERQLDKLVRYQARALRRLERTAQKRSVASEYSRTMLAQTSQSLAQEVERRSRTEEKLRVLLERSLEESDAKDRFLAQISHELRTPTNGLLGALDLAVQGDAPDEIRGLLGLSLDSARHLLALLDDILDFSKAEAGRLDLESVEFCPWEALEDAVGVLWPLARSKGLSLTHGGLESVPAKVMGDPKRYLQVLLNLLSNAIKFTEEGGVFVELSYASSMLWATVEDTGPGIDEETRRRVFAPYVQGDSSTTRRFGGTGLGLSIAQELAHLMEGSISIAPSRRGARFEFVARLPTACAGWQAEPGLRGLRVGLGRSVAEDRVLRPLLESLGCRVTAAGRAAPPPSLDCSIEAGEGDASARVPRVGVLQLGEGRGAGLVLRRPFKRSAVAEVLRGIRKREEGASPPQRRAPRDVRVLVAEDNRVNQLIVRRMLERLDFSCVVVGNGAEAVDALVEGEFPVVLMDCQMPELDGLEATRRIRRLPGLRQPVVIALTANVTEGTRRRCIDAGMDDFLGKPVDLATLERCLERWTTSPERSGPT